MPKKALVCILLLASFGMFSYPSTQPRAEHPRRPKLVVVIVIDQFRFDYLMRFRRQFVEGGFNFLLKGGANFVDCRYDYATTETCPGHASLFTGAYGNVHGIIENDWYDRSLKSQVYCAGDPDAKLIGIPSGAPFNTGMSPRNLIGTTIGDELRASDNFQSKVISISMKDRAAVLPGGHTANAAYWYDTVTGNFITSTYYMPELPSWMAEFNAQEPTKAYCGKNWQALPETPGAPGKVLNPAQSSNGPCPNPQFLAWLLGTPFMNEIELKLAGKALEAEHLGHGPETDLLAVSLSINDYIGHAFGPYSPQVADTILRTDRYLASFLQDLNRLVGLNNVWIILTADHGVAPNSEFVMEHKLGFGQFKGTRAMLPPTPSAPHSPALQLSVMAPLETPLMQAINRALSKAFGEGNWVVSASGENIYLDWRLLESKQIEKAKAESIAAEAALQFPGIEAAFTRNQLLTGGLPNSPVARKAAHSFNAKRGGDVFLVLSQYAVVSDTKVGSSHGSSWSYDAQVPLILWGGAFKPGVYTTPCQPIDLAATLAATLGLTQPSGSEGRPLTEAIK